MEAITIGTPIRISKISGDGEAYSYVELPVTFPASMVKVGNVATLTGTITDGDQSVSAGAEFAFAPTSKTAQVVNLGDVEGTFEFDFDVVDSTGESIYTLSDSINI